MTRKTSRIRPGHADGRYVVIHSDDDQRWTVEHGTLEWSGARFGPDFSRSNVVTPAQSPSAAIEKFAAPPGRVFRVLDIDNGDVHEFIVGHISTGAA